MSPPRVVLVLASVLGLSCYGASHDRVTEGAFTASDQNPDTCTAGEGECVSKYHQPRPNYTPSENLRCPHPEDTCWVKLAGADAD